MGSGSCTQPLLAHAATLNCSSDGPRHMTCTVSCEKGFVLHSSAGKRLGSTQVSGLQDGPWDQDLDKNDLTTLRWLERAQITSFLQPQPSSCFPNKSQLNEAPVLDPCAHGWCFCSGDPSVSLAVVLPVQGCPQSTALPG